MRAVPHRRTVEAVSFSNSTSQRRVPPTAPTKLSLSGVPAMGENQSSTQSELLSLAKFVADAQAARPQAWKSVERLKVACALEAGPISMLPRDLGDRSFSLAVKGVRRELGESFDESEPATWLSSLNVWLQGRAPVDLLVSDASSVLAAARTDRFVAKG